MRKSALFAADIIGFSTACPDARTQIQARNRLYDHIQEAFDLTGLPWWECHREDRGDGALVVAPTDTDPTLFLDPLAHHLRALLRRPHGDDPAPPLRLRLAVHYGEVHHDAHGVTSNDLILLFRLLDCATFKRALRTTDTALGMIVSNALYQHATRHSRHLDPSSYRPIRITAKEHRRTPAWIWGL
ncbi:hypothetical protein [Actinocorallia aurantiaca]|uniref:Guanylate cyclase domain-containing protein n=1 Tax=Actinocorallia aurantiaca TaxID=46204 RepID=A0ABP6GLF7_9ACTN